MDDQTSTDEETRWDRIKADLRLFPRIIFWALIVLLGVLMILKFNF